MKTLRFGIEIETVKLSRARLAQAIADATGGTDVGSGSSYTVSDQAGREWRVVPDASLNGADNGEIVSPILTYEDIPLLQNIVRAVHKAGARVDQSTGIHIHVDGSRFDAKGVTNLVKMMHKQERLIEQALGVSSTRLASYCRPIDGVFLRRLEESRPRDLQQLSQAWYGYRQEYANRYDSSRYHGLNLNSLFFRGTIEFRLFNGTLHAGEIKTYVQFVLALAAKALSAKSSSSRRRETTPATSKYDMRVWLLRLGFIGDEFKTARLHLMKRLGGSSAWRGERRDRAAAVASDPNEKRAVA